MTLNHIKIFIQVYKEENITKAAENLHMTQPAVSRAIRELENYYNVVLFERINKRLKITDCGKKLYNQAVNICTLFDNMEENLKSWDEFGTIRIGSSLTLGDYLLPQLVANFSKKYPQIDISFLVSNTKNLHEALKHNKIDIALIEGEILDDDFSSMFLLKDKLVLALNESHPLMKQEKIKINDLEKYNFLTRELGSTTRTYIENLFALNNLKITPVLESSSPMAIVNSVHYGLGIALIPEQLAKHYTKKGYIHTKPVDGEHFVRKNYIVWHKNKLISKTITRFMRECINFVADNPEIYNK